MKNVFIFFLVLILSQFVSVAAIIYTDIDPDTLINGDGVTSGQIVYNVDIDNSNNHTGQWDGDLMLTLNKVDANNYYIDMFLSYNLSVEVVVNPDYYDYAAALEKNVPINSQSNWKADYGSAINMEDAWNNQKDKFIGVRYKKSGSWQYGWVRLDISNNYTDFTVKDFAFQDDADAGINTGEGIETNPVENNYSDTVWIQSQTTIAKMSPSGYYICTGDNNSLKLLKAIDGSEVWNKNTDATIVGLTISNNNRFIATSHTDLKIRVWELETGDLFTTLLEDYTNPYNYTTSGILEFSADDQLIAQRMEIVIAGFVNYGIVIVDFKNGTIRKEFPASEEEILNMKFTKDGKYFVIPSNNFTDSKFCVKIYDVNDFSFEKEISTGYTQQIWDLAVSPDSKMVGTSGDDGVFVWDIETSQNVLWVQPPNLIWAIGFSADSKYVLIGNEKYGGSTAVINIEQMSLDYEYHNRGFLNIQDAANTNFMLLNSGSEISVLRKKFGDSKDFPMLTANVGNDLFFPNVEINEEEIKTIKIANYSTDTLLVTNIDLEGLDYETFEILNPPALPLSIIPGSEFGLNIKCIIYESGEYTYSAEIHIRSDAYNTREFGIYEIFVSAKAPGATGAVISNDYGESYNLGTTNVSEKLTKPLTIRNTGNEDLIISNIGLIQYVDFFSIEQTLNFPVTVHSNDSLVLDISFLCNTPGYNHSGNIYFISNAINTDSMVINLSASTIISGIENHNISDNNKFEIKFYPNPLLDKGTIELILNTEIPENISLYLIDITGKKVKDLFSEYMLPGKITLELQKNNLSAGTYFIIVNTMNFSKLYPIIIK